MTPEMSKERSRPVASAVAAQEAPAREGPAPPRRAPDEPRFRAMVKDHLDFTWRSLRRLGLPADVADDATQRVFLVASRKLANVAPGSERSFLFNTAVRVASSEKRTFARRREVMTGDDPETRDAASGPDELIDQRRARDLLEELLRGLPMDLRTAFVLFELEGMTTSEVAATLGLPMGTAASRLRRAREEFREALKRHEARAGRRRK